MERGKALKPCEFGVKVSVTGKHESGLMVGARSIPHNPDEGHILTEQCEQTCTVLRNIGVKPTAATIDLGFGGVDEACALVRFIHRGRFTSLDAPQRRWLNMRPAIGLAILLAFWQLALGWACIGKGLRIAPGPESSPRRRLSRRAGRFTPCTAAA